MVQWVLSNLGEGLNLWKVWQHAADRHLAAVHRLVEATALCRSALILYRQILDGIEKNGYNNFSKRAYVPKWKKLASLPFAAVRAQMASNLKAANQPQAAAS